MNNHKAETITFCPNEEKELQKILIPISVHQYLSDHEHVTNACNFGTLNTEISLYNFYFKPDHINNNSPLSTSATLSFQLRI